MFAPRIVDISQTRVWLAGSAVVLAAMSAGFPTMHLAPLYLELCVGCLAATMLYEPLQTIRIRVLRHATTIGVGGMFAGLLGGTLALDAAKVVAESGTQAVLIFISSVAYTSGILISDRMRTIWRENL